MQKVQQSHYDMNNKHHHSRDNNLTRHDMNNKHHHSRAESSTISLDMI